MGWLEKANPIADAQKAIKKRNCKLYAINTIGIEIPGDRALINNMTFLELYELYGFKMIEGTSDSIINDVYSNLNAKAREYATSYNEKIYTSSCFAHM